MDRARCFRCCLLLLATALGGFACGRGPGPSAPTAGAAGDVPDPGHPDLVWPPGRWAWRWTVTTGSEAGSASGPAELTVTGAGAGARWSWRFPDGLPPAGRDLWLVPADTTVWLPAAVPAGAAGTAWLPLPRWPVDSPGLPPPRALLRELTTPQFGAVVVHWPGTPRPRCASSRPAPANWTWQPASRAAVDRWNEGEAAPWFVPCDTAAWGVRLVHLAGRRLEPAPAGPDHPARRRRDGPCGSTSWSGDNYDDRRDSIYAVRGFVHELGHALFLWGHSRDRIPRAVGRGAAPGGSARRRTKGRPRTCGTAFPRVATWGATARSFHLEPAIGHGHRPPVHQGDAGQGAVLAQGGQQRGHRQLRGAGQAGPAGGQVLQARRGCPSRSAGTSGSSRSSRLICLP